MTDFYPGGNEPAPGVTEQAYYAFVEWARGWVNNVSPAAPEHVEQPCEDCDGSWAFGWEGRDGVAGAHHDAGGAVVAEARVPVGEVSEASLDAAAQVVVCACREPEQ